MKEKYYNEKAECMAREKLIMHMSESLHRQIEYVWVNQPPYRKKMEHAKVTPSDIRDIGDIVKLPFTEKADLLSGYPFGYRAAPAEDIVRINATSGTTGKMCIVPCTQNDIDLFTEGLCRAFVMQGCGKGTVVQNMFSYSMFIGGMGVQYAVEKLGGTLIPASTGNTQRQIEFLKDFHTDNFACTPSYALHIARTMKLAGINKNQLSLKGCFLAGERVSDRLSAEISSELGVEVFDVYGNAEMTNVFASCRYNTGKHIPEDMIYVEIIDEKGNVLPTGCEGEIVITTLCKTGMPLIRYRTGDISVLLDSPCPCGRTGRRIGKISGRRDDMITVRGCKIYPSQIECAIAPFGFLTGEYRLSVSNGSGGDIVSLRVEPKKDCAHDIKNFASDIIDAVKISTGITVEVDFCNCTTEGDKLKRITDMRK